MPPPGKIDSDANHRRTKPLEQVEADALIVPIFEGRKEARFGAKILLTPARSPGKPWK